MENLSRALIIIIITCVTFHPVEDGLLIYRGGGGLLEYRIAREETGSFNDF